MSSLGLLGAYVSSEESSDSETEEESQNEAKKETFQSIKILSNGYDMFVWWRSQVKQQVGGIVVDWGGQIE